MDNGKDFTVDIVNWPNFKEYLDELAVQGVKTVIISHPTYIVNETDYEPYHNGLKRNIFIRWPYNTSDYQYTNSTIMVGYVNFHFKFLPAHDHIK